MPDWPFYGRLTNDLLLLWGQCNFRSLLRGGVDAERMKVVGATIYDDLVPNRAVAGAKDPPSATANLRIALMASRSGGTAVSYGAARQVLTTVMQAVAGIAGAELIVKIHPGDHTGLVERTIRDRAGCTAIKEGDSGDVIRRSDVAIVISSATGMEVCIADKPLVVLRVRGVPDAVPYENYGAAIILPVDSSDAAERLASAIRSLAESPTVRAELADGRRRLIEDMLNGGTGDARQLTASERIADAGWRERPATRTDGVAAVRNERIAQP